MIDKRHTDLCAVLLSTGQLNVIHLPSGATLFHRSVGVASEIECKGKNSWPFSSRRHLQFDGQLKLALHQPRFSGTQRIAIKFRNFVNFYDLCLSSVSSEIALNHIRTLRITRCRCGVSSTWHCPQCGWSRDSARRQPKPRAEEAVWWIAEEGQSSQYLY